MKTQHEVINPEFASLHVEERSNPYQECIQGLANEPITVQALLRRAAELLDAEPGFAGLGEISQAVIVERLVANRPRICIIAGSPDHPAHLYDHEHVLRAAARIWQNGGVPFAFGLPVICDGTAQSNIGQSYSLASRNHSAMAVNINFEGHSYHAAYVLSGCDKTPTGILSGLAAADRARRAPERGTAPVWAVFVPAHVLKGGTIPATTREKLLVIQDKARAAGDEQLADDIENNCHYILQCSSDEAFLGMLNRAVEHDLIGASEARTILNELAAATCDDKGGICAFNGSGNSSRTLVSALGFVPPEAELLIDEPPTALVSRYVDSLFRLINRPEYAVCEILAANYANAIRIHNATGSSSNLMLHMPAVMRHAGFDVSLFDYEAIGNEHPVPDIFAHSLTQQRDTYVLAQQWLAGHHHGIASLYKALETLRVPLDLDAPTVAGKTWGERLAAIDVAVSPALPQERSVIRIHPIRDISGTDILRGNFFSSCTLKVSGMATAQYECFNDHVFVVRYYENEHPCNDELHSGNLVDTLAEMPELTPELLAALRRHNHAPADEDIRTMIERGTLSFAFVIAGQGPKAFGMPEMFAPSQYLRHHGVVEKTSIMMTDGRYSGVTKGACVGHTVPEAFEGGGIGALMNGDLLWVRLSDKRIDLLDRQAFLRGELVPLAAPPFDTRRALMDERRARMEKRQAQIAACSLLDSVSTAEYGVVPMAVHRRATLPWRKPSGR
ncbi:dihydroxy-acid dehydratase [Propionivibrio dicarboxylicus]|uniref:Dihydroxyacid dehydratase/phosphogluconate dehydratase n=1 Tax=Propionivibrio dicarboxylicus TaxID=83767 RepID=A0A1G7XYG9_9RHOO|nr:dihydroxy-acid dehydratase [Propionivibrio dicarboxylicus]SDG89197.1 Dihydroxyacid dehydratase/phosphogluconate dehydratase [Propionivibrio dicarboxylicus]